MQEKEFEIEKRMAARRLLAQIGLSGIFHAGVVVSEPSYCTPVCRRNDSVGRMETEGVTNVAAAADISVGHSTVVTTGFCFEVGDHSA